LERTDWVIVSPPDYDQEHNSWEYLIRTCDLDGVELHLKIVPGPEFERWITSIHQGGLGENIYATHLRNNQWKVETIAA
jgi:hypothetical protein